MARCLAFCCFCGCSRTVGGRTWWDDERCLVVGNFERQTRARPHGTRGLGPHLHVKIALGRRLSTDHQLPSILPKNTSAIGELHTMHSLAYVVREPWSVRTLLSITHSSSPWIFRRVFRASAGDRSTSFAWLTCQGNVCEHSYEPEVITQWRFKWPWRQFIGPIPKFCQCNPQPEYRVSYR